MMPKISVNPPWWAKWNWAPIAEAATADEPRTDCGQWASYGGPCGGCSVCLDMQASYALFSGYTDPAMRAKAFGLEFWPIITHDLGREAPSHEISHLFYPECRR